MDLGEEVDLPSCSEETPSPVATQTSTRRKMNGKSGKPVKLGPPVCAVCQGKATGHHYDVASCNGCKSFFRRVTTESLSYVCQAQKKCYDDLVPGGPVPKCRACRFQRCIDSGMNHLGIQSELRKLKEKERRDSTTDQSTSSESSDLVVLPKFPKLTIEAQVSDLIEQLVYLDLKSIAFRDSAYNPRTFPMLKDSVKEEISMIGIADKVGPMTNWPIDSRIEEEIYKDVTKLPHFVKKWATFDFLVMIELAKTFPFYSKLSENDRFILFRETILMATNLSRAYYSYEQKSDCLVRPDGLTHYNFQRKTGMVRLLDEETRNRVLYDVSRRCLKALIRLRPDKIEFILIRSIIFCNNAVCGLSQEAQKILSTERDKYTVALFRYIMTQQGMNGPARFANILNVIDVLEHQQRDQRDVNVCIALVRPKNIKVPLLDEIMKIEHIV